jgi:hypothetical protein
MSDELGPLEGCGAGLGEWGRDVGEEGHVCRIPVWDDAMGAELGIGCLRSLYRERWAAWRWMPC